MPDRPNILLITTDQQRFDTIHAAGNPKIRTPHLNWLLDGGVRFTRCYSDAPLCVATRATIMTGRHGYTNGLTSNAGEPRPIRPETSLPGLLTRAGYQTRAQGKMHFNPMRCTYGFEQWEILEHYYRELARHPEVGTPKDHGIGENEMEPVVSTVPESHSLTHWTVRRSVDFLETRDPDRPFFLWTSFAKPHPPLDPCEPYWRMYENVDVPMPVTGDWSQRPEDVPPAFMQGTWHLNQCDRFDNELIRAARRAYYACITQIDYNLGLLFARMRELDLFENTLILFTSDHGDMMGDHHMGAKMNFFEGSAHIPMLVRGPRELIPEALCGTTCDGLANPADVYTTAMAAAGVEIPERWPVDGLDLLAMARGEAERPRLHGQCMNSHAVLEGHYKYMFHEAGGTEMLFDLDTDPMERNELIRAGGHADVLERMRGRLVERLGPDHAAVQDGALVATAPEPEERAVRARSWPGYHSIGVPADVLH